MATRFGKTGWVGAAVIAAALLPSLMASRAEAQIGLYEVARFNLAATSTAGSATYIGSNPIAVGWNGTKLYVAGFSGTGAATLPTSIIQITNAASGVAAGGFVTPTYSGTFGTISTAATRGYTGLAMQGNQLAASWDGGSNNVNGIQMFNASTNTQSWNLSATGTNLSNVGTTRGYAGPDFDPGYLGTSGSGSGLGWLTQGSGRRLLNNQTNGLPIYTSATNAALVANYPSVELGMIMSPDASVIPASASSWRDVAFDPATGNLYARNQFGVVVSNRTGSNIDINPLNNTPGQSGYLYVNSGTTASNNVGVTIGYMNSVQSSSVNAFSNSYAGDLLVFNDRSSTSNGQSWTNVIKFMTTSGSSVTPNWTFLSAPATGNGAYDYEWDQASQTLAVVDYANRNVSIFSTAVPEPSTWAMLVIGGGVSGAAAVRRRLRRQG